MSSSEDERPAAFGGGSSGLGFSMLGKRTSDNELGGVPPVKRMKLEKSPTATSSGGAAGFAARMMAKMGYKEGQGLGAEGRGRLAPIDAQLRPQGAGLGAVREKTKQAKEEERRAAALDGRVLDDSSGEEKKRRKKLKEKRIVGEASGPGTAGQSRARPRLKYRTATEIEAGAEGLHVPNVLKSIIDVTGKETKILTTASGILIPGNMVLGETEATKLARRARRDLEAFADEWSTLADQKKYYDLQTQGLVTEMDTQEEETNHLRGLSEAVQAIQQLCLAAIDGACGQDPWEVVTTRLEAMEVDYKDDLSKFGLQEVAVAAIHPLFRKAMLEWDPLSEPTYLVTYLTRLKYILGIDVDPDASSAVALADCSYQARPSRMSTSHYETLIYTLWLPPVRTAIINWNVEDPESLTALVSAWKPLLPPFVLSNLINQLLLPRLASALAAWKPSRDNKKSRSRQTISRPLHTWLIDWLVYLPASQLDPDGHSGLLVDLKRKVRSLVEKHDLTTGIPGYLRPLKDLLGSSYKAILTTKLLPRLAAHLSAHLIVDPADQDLTPLEQVLAFAELFPSTTIAHLLAAEFFPKFHAILYQWLIQDPNYDEIRQWFLWWKEQLPCKVRDLPPLDGEWATALQTINHALELGPDAATHLPLPQAYVPAQANDNGNGTPVRPSSAPAPAQTPKSAPPMAEITFRDVVEDFCAKQELQLFPLHEAHLATGLPLFRLTAGVDMRKGGVRCYLKGDVLWIKESKGKEWLPGELGTPTGLDEGLVRLANRAA